MPPTHSASKRKPPMGRRRGGEPPAPASGPRLVTQLRRESGEAGAGGGGRGRRDPFPPSSDGRRAPGWSPAAAEQRTRAAWSSRPSPGSGSGRDDAGRDQEGDRSFARVHLSARPGEELVGRLGA